MFSFIISYTQSIFYIILTDSLCHFHSVPVMERFKPLNTESFDDCTLSTGWRSVACGATWGKCGGLQLLFEDWERCGSGGDGVDGCHYWWPRGVLWVRFWVSLPVPEVGQVALPLASKAPGFDWVPWLLPFQVCFPSAFSSSMFIFNFFQGKQN